MTGRTISTHQIRRPAWGLVADEDQVLIVAVGGLDRPGRGPDECGQGGVGAHGQRGLLTGPAAARHLGDMGLVVLRP